MFLEKKKFKQNFHNLFQRQEIEIIWYFERNRVNPILHDVIGQHILHEAVGKTDPPLIYLTPKPNVMKKTNFEMHLVSVY